MLTLTSPVETPWHRVAAGWKLAVLAAVTAGLFALRDPAGLGLALLAVGGAYAAGGLVFLRHGVAMLRPLWPFLLLLAAWHLWSGEVCEGVVIGLRLVTAVAAANLVTMTTRLSDMVAVMELVLAPLGRLGVPVGRVALGLALAVRFVPVMLERAGAVREAWRARSPRRPGWRVMVPVTLAALDDAERVAEALRARGGAG
jgi:biotin transport system permease protein